MSREGELASCGGMGGLDLDEARLGAREADAELPLPAAPGSTVALRSEINRPSRVTVSFTDWPAT